MADGPMRIAQAPEPRSGFADYEYDIFLGDRRIARYGHDYRGGEHWIRFGDGPRQECALGPVWVFAPTTDAGRFQLTPEAVAWLRQQLGDGR